ncbi:MAG: type II toxin-antitoxin system VapC family toxin [Phycisphaerae bacterium]
MILVDTNILARYTNSGDPQGLVVRRALERLKSRGESVVMVPQNIHEFWAVATRPRGPRPMGENGLGMSVEVARAWIQFFCRRYALLPDLKELTASWLALVADNRVTGYRCHDARLVAAMATYGIQRILTFNAKDFSALGINVVDPQTV